MGGGSGGMQANTVTDGDSASNDLVNYPNSPLPSQARNVRSFVAINMFAVITLSGPQ